ncbi:MAG: hypothetical protein CM15mP89_2460 [Gammaproteobacteria bacterium]|nr:MAG: hypothetical protein CM15mP89_2460 [Gammaproteobacteria bacterium]
MGLLQSRKPPAVGAGEDWHSPGGPNIYVRGWKSQRACVFVGSQLAFGAILAESVGAPPGIKLQLKGRTTFHQERKLGACGENLGRAGRRAQCGDGLGLSQMGGR